MEGLGLPAFGLANYLFSAETSPLTSAFLNMRYLISHDGQLADDGVFWNKVAEVDGRIMLENNWYLPLGFMVKAETVDYKGFGGAPYIDTLERGEAYSIIKSESAPETPFCAQNDLFRRATGLEGDLFTMLDVNSIDSTEYEFIYQGNGKYTFSMKGDYQDGIIFAEYKMPVDGCLYVYMYATGAGDAKVIVENSIFHGLNIHRPYIFPTGSFGEGEVITIGALSEVGDGEAWIYAGVLDRDLFERGFARLSEETFELTEFSDTRISGRISAKESGLLYTSIPHAGLWKAFVNGQEAEIVTIDGAMAALWLNAGENLVEFRYHNRFLTIGIVVSLVSIILFFAIVIWQHRREKRIPNKALKE